MGGMGGHGWGGAADNPVVRGTATGTRMRSRGLTPFARKFRVEGSKSFVRAADGDSESCRRRRREVGCRSINVGDSEFDIGGCLASTPTELLVSQMMEPGREAVEKGIDMEILPVHLHFLKVTTHCPQATHSGYHIVPFATLHLKELFNFCIDMLRVIVTEGTGESKIKTMSIITQAIHGNRDESFMDTRIKAKKDSAGNYRVLGLQDGIIRHGRGRRRCSTSRNGTR